MGLWRPELTGFRAVAGSVVGGTTAYQRGSAVGSRVSRRRLRLALSRQEPEPSPPVVRYERVWQSRQGPSILRAAEISQIGTTADTPTCPDGARRVQTQCYDSDILRQEMPRP